jgi:radical SAM-linked protein
MDLLSRFRIHFGKTEAMRFTSHLDLHRTWERTFRRAQLPLAYSKGFHPQPRLALACALPLGFTSEAELLDVWLEQPIHPNHVAANLLKALPPGVDVYKVNPVDLNSPALQIQLQSAEYLISLKTTIYDLEERIHTLLSSESILRRRREKLYDLRPLVELVEISGEWLATLTPCFRTRLAAREGATGRPEELLLAMGLDFSQARIHRLKLYFRD